MNYTQNYHLPQWVKSDRILMDDFNRMCAAIDSGMNTIDSKATSAQSTATTAVNKKNYVTGSYTGTGETRAITLGFRPSFVIVSGMKPATDGNAVSSFTTYFGITGGRVLTGRIEPTASGFTVHAQDLNHGYHPDFTQSGRTYDYIAFR